MASPTKVISVSIMTNVPKADMTIQGAVRRELVPCFRSSPKIGVGGGSPKPKKSSAVIAVIAAIVVIAAIAEIVVIAMIVLITVTFFTKHRYSQCLLK